MCMKGGSTSKHHIYLNFIVIHIQPNEGQWILSQTNGHVNCCNLSHNSFMSYKNTSIYVKLVKVTVIYRNTFTVGNLIELAEASSLRINICVKIGLKLYS